MDEQFLIPSEIASQSEDQTVCILSLCVCVCVSLTDDKVSDQYVVQRPSVRTSKRKDEFIWYDKTSGELH